MKMLEGFLEKSDLDDVVWRYMSLDKLDLMLTDKSLYFASAEQFNGNDNHEGAITEKDYQRRIEFIKRHTSDVDIISRELESLENAFKPLRKYAKICCWHINRHENIAMWRFYQGKGKGIAVESTLRKLIENFGPYKVKDTYDEETLNVGRIKYIDYETDSMDRSHGFLTPFLYKRKEYEDENEVRFIISLRLAVEFGVIIPEKGINVPFNTDLGINRFILSPDSDLKYEKDLNDILIKNSCKIKADLSNLIRKPRY